jgi:hypothetical protein
MECKTPPRMCSGAKGLSPGEYVSHSACQEDKVHVVTGPLPVDVSPLLRIAEDYERLAERAERRGQTSR